MRAIPRDQILRHLTAENPWWQGGEAGVVPYASLRPRAYFEPFLELVRQQAVRRAVVLMGPRRVGKTVLIHHAIRELLRSGVDPRQIVYVSVDHPLYSGIGLDALLDDAIAATPAEATAAPAFVFFDEIQYVKDWEVHLKALVDRRPQIKLVASGSAAAALRLKSNESGAGRFTDFLLPPLTFHEYLWLLGQEDRVTVEDRGHGRAFHLFGNVESLNASFLHYLNFGGYPEVIFSPQIQADPARFIKADIVDKVLLRDLPSLYGIQDIQELNALFTTLAFNSGDEISLDGLSKRSGVAKNTLKRYIEYLEAAFLVRVVHRLDRSARRFQRAHAFKVYLTNPSMRSALFAPLTPDDEAIGTLVETAVFAQWFHDRLSAPGLHYARWSEGEVDLVKLDAAQQVEQVVEVKWSDHAVTSSSDLRALTRFCRVNGHSRAVVTTRSTRDTRTIDGTRVDFIPASLYCFMIGYDAVHGRRWPDASVIAVPGAPTIHDGPPAA